MILAHASDSAGLTIANMNLHGAYLFEHDQAFRTYTESADLCLIDGWPILKLLRSRRHRAARFRTGSTDWLQELLDSGVPLTIAAIGGTAEASALAAAAISRDYPSITWVGVPGYQLERSAESIARAVAAASLVLVGMGMPRQERWILDNRPLLANKVVANVGGCIDYFAGTQDLAPRWLGAVGLEWLYRLSRDPARLASRYLLEPVKLCVALIRRRLGTR
ncbi:WecB/TagA/CpsF family glycosyltransferase [Demequina silvatica]|uniref:WecB/TagA/CpsF family glycosyltransferase n=1 Tax=Demequina silvatica TaxID=1638988 RepID=UPI0009E36CB4